MLRKYKETGELQSDVAGSCVEQMCFNDAHFDCTEPNIEAIRHRFFAVSARFSLHKNQRVFLGEHV